MPHLREGAPYVWATWIAKLIAGDSHCEWAAWFRARYDASSWRRQPRGDFEPWQIQHTALLRRAEDRWAAIGFVTTCEEQNHFRLSGRQAYLNGKPDLIAVKDDAAVVIDVKTGRPRPSHSAQVLLYMYAVPRAMPEHQDRVFDGAVVYEDHVVNIPADAVDRTFVEDVSALMRRLAAPEPPRSAPSIAECRFCDITEDDCPVRAYGDPQVGRTDDF